VSDRIPFHGRLTSVQPRIRLKRYVGGERSHTYVGYALRVDGTIRNEKREFWVGVGKVTHAKYRFEIGLVVSGVCRPRVDRRMGVVEFYRVSKLTVEKRIPRPRSPGPPWLGVPPDLAVYQVRRQRRLDARTYEVNCCSCVWGWRMAVETIMADREPPVRRYGTEPCCYGLGSCTLYKARSVPYEAGR
jgi:hypothetical protein